MSMNKGSRGSFGETSCAEPNIYELPSRQNASKKSGRESQRRSERRTRPKQTPLFGYLIPIFMLVVVILMIIMIIGLFLNYNKPDGKGALQSSNKHSSPKTIHRREGNNSCEEFRKNGFTASGIYEIQANTVSKSHEVYCDMETDGGGWTLVASVHRYEDGTKCGFHDKWTQFRKPQPSKDGFIDSLWSSKATEGTLTKATRADYKSLEYFSRNASDVMLWHVPNGVDVTEIDEQAFLKYHTTNRFLDSHGSTLRELYKDDAKLKQLNNIGLDLKIIDLIRAHISPSISSIVTSWYSYSYDAGTTASYIIDGGRNMYDTGNQVYFREADKPYKLMQYGQSYTDSKTYHISSAAIHPFTTIATISNFDGYPQKFGIKVESTGKGSSAHLRRQQISIYRNKITIQAMAYSVYYESRPSTTMLFFCIENKLNSKKCIFEPGYTTSSTISYGFHLIGTIDKAIIGYMLLSRYYTSRNSYVSDTEVRNLLDKIANLLDYPEMDLRPLHNVQPITAPVNIVEGSISYPGHNVTSGYLQFRAYDYLGYAYAMCPGVRLNGKTDPAKFCIGSAKTADRNRCGDFSAWESLREHVFQNRSQTNGTFVNDLHSTILIFTR